jgi:flavin-dependent dehydrogenase
MRADYDAIIVGAGPAGSTTAILLAQAGWNVALVERQRFPRRKVCGECVAASNLPLLDALGLGRIVAEHAGPQLQCVALMHGPHTRVAALPAAGAPHRWGRALARETLDTALLRRAREAGATVLQPWAVVGLDGGPGHWRCRVRALCRAGGGKHDDENRSDYDGADADAETFDSQAGVAELTAPLAIAAHGSWEPLPSERPLRRAAHAGSQLFAFKANFRNTRLAAGLLPVLCLDGGYGGMVLAGDGVTTIACCVRRDRLEALRAAAPGEGAGEVVEGWLRRSCDGVAEALAGARREGAWLAAGPIGPGVRLRADDGIFRVGNAAGEAHPILGEGMSMALQSAALLSTLMLRDPAALRAGNAKAQRHLGQQYAAQWQHHFVPRLRLAAAFAHAAMRPTSTAMLGALVHWYPSLLGRGARWGGKTRSAVLVSSLESSAAGQAS